MSATLIGTTGSWGITSDQTGLLLESIDFDYKDKEKAVLNKSGETIGYSFYDEMVETSIKGLATSTSPFAGTLGANLAMSNAIPDHLQGTVTGGQNLIRSVKKSLAIEDFVRFETMARYCPLITGS
jgi:hypothetical protein